MVLKRIELETNGFVLKPNEIIYLCENVDVETNPRLYKGKPIVRVQSDVLQRAYNIILTITDQHLKPARQDKRPIPRGGVSQHFQYDSGLNAYVYGPDSLDDIRHIKLVYDSALRAVQIAESLGLPPIETAFTNKNGTIRKY